MQDMDKMSVNSTTICVKYEEPSHCLADMVSIVSVGSLCTFGFHTESNIWWEVFRGW